MKHKQHKQNTVKLIVLIVLFIAAVLLYMTYDVKFDHPKLAAYAFKVRTPKLIAMMITAFAIGSASIVFQTVINNRIVTPCLLGMDALYTMIHTTIVFFLGTGSVLVMNANYAFAIDLVVMCVLASFIYGYLFKKTGHNVLYVMLIGTVLTSLFSSIQSTLTRVMDPNEYDSLLATLVASFSNVNAEIIIFSLILLIAVAIWLYKEIGLLDVLALSKEKAINLGVDYDTCIRKLLLGVVLYMAIATALVGPLAFLGLIIANLSRQYFQTFHHTWLVGGSIMFGLITLIGGQLIVEQIFVYAIPISVFITLFGGIYFLYLLLRRRA